MPFGGFFIFLVDALFCRDAGRTDTIEGDFEHLPRVIIEARSHYPEGAMLEIWQ